MSKGVERNTQIIDQGAIIGDFVAVIRPTQKSVFQRHFTMIQDASRILVKELTGEQSKVLMLMLEDLDSENFTQIAPADIDETLVMQKMNVSLAVRELLDDGVIYEGPTVGRLKTYQLNEPFGWKGTVNNHKMALKSGFSVIQGVRI